MSITFTGDEIPEAERILTGFYSLDKALRNPQTDSKGFPIRTMVEIYGASGLGKTTFMVSLAGIFAIQLGGKIAFASLEKQSKNTVANSLEMSGFAGELDLLRDGKTIAHYQILDKMIDELREPACNVAMLDSVGAFMSPGEDEGSVVDANMGQRPRIMGNWTRKITDVLAKPKKRGVCMYVTHQHPNIGFVGNHTSGGVTKNFLNDIQIELKKKDNYETGWIIEGKITKNRYGQVGQYFHVFCIGGQGIHKGMSAVFDCVSAGLAEVERNVVKMDGNSYGKVARMIETWQDEEQFNPFINALIARDVPVEEAEEVVEEKKTRKKK